MIEFVVREGHVFEAIIMNKEKNNPDYKWVPLYLPRVFVLKVTLYLTCFICWFVPGSSLTTKARITCTIAGSFSLFCRYFSVLFKMLVQSYFSEKESQTHHSSVLTQTVYHKKSHDKCTQIVIHLCDVFSPNTFRIRIEMLRRYQASADLNHIFYKANPWQYVSFILTTGRVSYRVEDHRFPHVPRRLHMETPGPKQLLSEWWT